MGQWTLPGPDKLTLSKVEVCAILGVSDSTLDREIKAGRFPRGIKPSAKSEPFWTATDIAAWLHIAGRLATEPEPDEKPEKKSSGA